MERQSIPVDPAARRRAVTIEDPRTRENLEGWLRMPLEVVAEQLARLGVFLLDLGNEATRLASG